MSTPALAVENVHVAYGKAEVLRGFNLTVEEGEFVAVVGPNGAGKTTLLRALSRLVPSLGRILLYGNELPERTTGTVAAGLIQCPERRRLFPDLTVETNLRLGGYRHGSRSDLEPDLEHVYEMFPTLRERSTQQAGTMSGGEQQQCAIARALMARPRLLLLDEPSLGLSVGVLKTIANSIETLRATGTTAILVEQDVSFAVRCADRLVVLEHGQVALEGPAETVVNDPYIQSAYLGVL